MTEGSRWYFPVFEGLIDPKHAKGMGSAIWLYLFLLSRALVAQRGGILNYNHEEAAKQLGYTSRTIKTWFARLQKQGYIHRRARFPQHLEVEVSNWRPLEEWFESRREVKVPSSLHKRSEERSEERGEDMFIPSITISLQYYKYPTGPRSEKDCTSLADAFRGLLDRLKQSKNRNALLKEAYSLCFGTNGDQPDYGYLGKVAKRVGGAGRLAEMMWQLTTKPPTGDILAYILGMRKGEARQKKRHLTAEDYGWDTSAPLDGWDDD